MHAGIVVLILFYTLGVAPSAAATFVILCQHRSVRGSDVVLSVLGGLGWPGLFIASIVAMLCQSGGGTEAAQ